MNGRAVLLALFVVLAMVGAFLAGNYLSTPRILSTESTSGRDILARAQASVPQPILPPKPSGREVTSTEQRQVEVDVPTIQIENQSIGPLGVSIGIPRVVSRREIVNQPVSVTKLVDASPAEIAAWEAEVSKRKRQYESAIQLKVEEISKEENTRQRQLLISGVENFTKNTLIPLITALTGLIGAMATLRWGSKTRKTAADN